ncbi:MAG: class II fructose-bisphosphate aldolase family protein [Candidatus Komeilibacteria bacterium]|nr:class II fructose-bisphosphate aldolase family protein [Candidatus Komeilibacteria bacterium]
MIVHIKKIIRHAQRSGYAVGAFNTINLETTQGIVNGGVTAKSPLIIQVSEKTIRYAGLSSIYALITDMAQTLGKKVPIAVHLDHGHSLEIIKDCIAIGFSSVHYDGSELPFAENIRQTKKAVLYGHRRGVWVQGELGRIMGKEGLVKITGESRAAEGFTKPDQVKEFVRKTGVDTLAVSIGTLHGSFSGVEKVDLDLLRQVRHLTKVPLVLHGGSGLSSKDLRQSVKEGITIVNIDTSLRIAFVESLRKHLGQNSKMVDFRPSFEKASVAITREVVQRCKSLGTYNQL